jgi:phosphate transport system protein
MAVRENFEAELNQLQKSLMEMGSLAQQAIQKSIEALKTQNVELALQIIDEDYKVDRLEEEINDSAILMIAKQQPVATDLRRIIVAIRIASDVERMADFAVNIAKSTIRIGDQKLIKPLEVIPKMCDIAIEMLSHSIRAYEEEDVVLAKKVADMDDRVDEMYGSIIRELLQLMTENPQYIAQVTQLSFVTRYIERIADHATNISESVFYLVKGKRYDLNE